MRTNIVIDDKVMADAMRIANLTTKKEVVERALREFIINHSRKDLSEIKGEIQFINGYNHRELREGR